MITKMNKNVHISGSLGLLGLTSYKWHEISSIVLQTYRHCLHFIFMWGSLRLAPMKNPQLDSILWGSLMLILTCYIRSGSNNLHDIQHVGSSNMWVHPTCGFFIPRVGSSHVWVHPTCSSHVWVHPTCSSHVWVHPTCGFIPRVHPTCGFIQRVGSSHVWVHPMCGFIQRVGSSNVWVHPTYGFIRHMGSSNVWVHPTCGFIVPSTT